MSDPTPASTRPEVPDQSFWARPPDAPPFGNGPRDPIRPPLARSWTDAVSERIQAWRADVRIGAVVLVLVALGAGLLWYRLGLSSGDGQAAAGDTTTAPTALADTSSTTTAPTRVVVHVAGAVAEPGVVELRPDARVIDALEAVGGALPEADLDRLNLAAKLADGQRVLVQRVGDPPAPADATGTPPADPAAPDGGTSGSPAGPLDINTATLEQLEELPGIGPVLAQAIIDERTRRGGFESVNELLDVSGIGDARFADIEALVTV